MAGDAYAEAVIQDAPQVWWRFEEATGFARDSSGSGSDVTGVVSGTVTRPVPGLLPASTGTAWRFAGGTSGVVRSVAGSFSHAAFTAELWFNAASFANSPVLMAHDRDGNPGDLRWRCHLDADGRVWVVYRLAGGSTVASAMCSGPALSVGATYHLVVTYDGSAFGWYLNGEPYGDPAPVESLDVASGGLLEVAAIRNTLTSATLDGVVDEFAYYPSVLPLSRIAAHFDAGTTVPEPPTRVVYHIPNNSAGASAPVAAPIDSDFWTEGNAGTAREMRTVRQNTPVADRSRVPGSTTGEKVRHDFRWVSTPVVRVGVLSGTVRLAIQARQNGSAATRLAWVVRILRADGTVRGNLVPARAVVDMPIAAAATGMVDAVTFTGVTFEPGDRLQIEIGRATSAVGSTSQYGSVMYYGDPEGAPYVTPGTTGDSVPYLELLFGDDAGETPRVDAQLTGTGAFTATAVDATPPPEPTTPSVAVDLTGGGVFSAGVDRPGPAIDVHVTGSGAFTAVAGTSPMRAAHLAGSGDFTATAASENGYVLAPAYLLVLDPTIEQTPDTVRVTMSNTRPLVEVVFRIDGVEVARDTSDVNGDVLELVLPVGRQFGAGMHTVTGTTAHRSAAGTFEVLADPNALPQPQAPSTPPQFVPEAVNRWVLQDRMPGGLGTWVMPINPTSMSSPHVRKTVASVSTTAVRGTPHVSEGAEPVEWEFAGFAPDKAFQDQLIAFSQLPYRFYLIDHRGRAWTVAISRLTITPRKRTKDATGTSSDWLADYSVALALFSQTPQEQA